MEHETNKIHPVSLPIITSFIYMIIKGMYMYYYEHSDGTINFIKHLIETKVNE